MSRGLRILHLADSHIGADLPARPRRTTPRRGDDLVASYRRVLDLAETHDVDLVIHAGDVFDLPDPHGGALRAAAEPLLKLAGAGVPVVIVPGNHERSILPESLLFSHPLLHIIRRPQTLPFRLRGMRVAISGVPCVRRESATGFPVALAQSGWEDVPADVRILVAHQTFESAVCGPVGYRFRTHANVVERDAIPAAFAYVAAGHIHRHQELMAGADGPPIVYAGSCDRVSFAERDEPKGAVLIEVRGGTLTHRFVEHAVRPMVLLPIDVSGRGRVQIIDEARQRIDELPADALALLRFSGQALPKVMRGLALDEYVRRKRPDVLLRTSTQALEFVPLRMRPQVAEPKIAKRRRQVVGAVRRSSFAVLEGDRAVPVCVAVDDRRRLPRTFGTYALHDADGRLLYVGKAKNVFTRVSSHLQTRSASGFFGRWAGQVAQIEMRTAGSELEALLVEAELIRKLRPPFNRQMRAWSKYCYLAVSQADWGQLAICAEPPRRGVAFGPYRKRYLAEAVREASAALFGLAFCPSEQDGGGEGRGSVGLFDGLHGGRLCRRYYDGLCCGPCAGRVSEAEYAERIGMRDALLLGKDDAALRRAEDELAGRAEEAGDAGGAERLRIETRRLETLRMVFEHGALLRRAEGLLGTRLSLSDGNGGQMRVWLTEGGLRFESGEGEGSGGGDHCRVRRAAARLADHARLPKAVVDCLCTAARGLDR